MYFLFVKLYSLKYKTSFSKTIRNLFSRLYYIIRIPMFGNIYLQKKKGGYLMSFLIKFWFYGVKMCILKSTIFENINVRIGKFVILLIYSSILTTLLIYLMVYVYTSTLTHKIRVYLLVYSL